jgi:drug/metabolite transporter (DMT)-like permease
MERVNWRRWTAVAVLLAAFVGVGLAASSSGHHDIRTAPAAHSPVTGVTPTPPPGD